tara:strand:- start:614 stop:1543 length:930 start_codon:yes stop_codon:yes gene_type:complete
MLKKIIFMGTPMFAVPILKKLYQNGYEVTVVYTQPPKKSKRGQQLNISPVQGISETLGVDVRSPTFLKKNEKEINFIKDLNADIAIVVAYGQIIPNEILSLTKKGFINIHASLLPKWRGAAPIQRSIMNLDKETGISIMRIIDKLDAGPVSKAYKISLTEDDNFLSVSEKLSILASEKLLENLDEILEGNLTFKEQDETNATYAKKILKSEGKIDWNQPGKSIIGKINALNPIPGAWFFFNGERYKILKAKLGSKNGIPGIVSNENCEVFCKLNSLKIIEIQREGKKPQKINEFLLGSKIKEGSDLNNA